VPAKLTVDGKVYEDVGVRFRGASSFFMTPEGRKRSLNISVDLAHKGQRLGSYRTLELLNSHTDPCSAQGCTTPYRRGISSSEAITRRLLITGRVGEFRQLRAVNRFHPRHFRTPTAKVEGSGPPRRAGRVPGW